MAMTLDEFAHDFFQEILSESDGDGQLYEDVFFEKFCTFLTDVGEIDVADRADYRHPTAGIRVDGYGGDPITSGGTLSLIITDFRQSSQIERLVGSEMNAIFQRLSKFLARSLDAKWRNALEETSAGFGLADMIAQRWNKVSRIRMFLISNRELSERVDGRKADEIDGRTVTYSVWDIKRLHRTATDSQGREEIEVDLKRNFGGAIPLLPAHLSADDYEAYLAVVPAETLGAVYDQWGARLLEQNVRVFLQARGNVNKGIRNTLQNDPSMFFAYNNGITATAEEVITEKQGGQLMLSGLKNLQIVNGGQTTASIHVAFRNKVDLSNVFVQMKLSIVEPNRTSEVVPRISEYANSQNRVNAADFFANHPFHVKMEAFSRRMFAPSPDGTFRETKWFYERARGQFQDARSLLTPAQKKKFDLENPRAQLFSKTDLAKFQTVWECLPDKVCLGAQKNFAFFAHGIGKAWKKNEEDFNESYFRETVAKAIVFKAAEKIISSQPWYPGTIRSQLVAYSIAKIAYDVDDMKRVDRLCRALENSGDQQRTGEVHRACLEAYSRGVGGSCVSHRKCWRMGQEAGMLGTDQSSGYQLEQWFPRRTNNERGAQGRVTYCSQRTTDAQRIEAQSAVVRKGNEFWNDVLEWGRKNKLLSASDLGILRVATQMPSKIPSELQATKTVEILARLNKEGFTKTIDQAAGS